MSSMTKLERAFRPFTIPNLTNLLAMGMGIVYAIGFAVPMLSDALRLEPAGVLQGEVWRLLTFPTVIDVQHGGFSFIFAFFAIYIFYLTGNVLERHWGHVRFNLYIFCFVFFTILLTMIPPHFGLISQAGMAPLYYNNSMLVFMVFLGFTMVMPDMEFLIFFILPVKVKYIAWITSALALFSMLLSPLWAGRPILVAFATFLAFFGREVYVNIRYGRRRIRERIEMARQEAVPAAQSAFHTCAECGKTDVTHSEEDFRYCPDCDGQLAYCSEHIFNHEHR
jgi:hypothetical protein